jgi:hypothetical protein
VRTAKIEQVGEDLFIKALIGSLPEMKTLGAAWDARRGAWKLPAAKTHLESVKDLIPDLTGDLSLRPLVYSPAPDARLFPHQTDGAGRLAAAPHGQLVCMSPGLGKTAVAIVAADIAVPTDQVVVVAPAGPLLRTWKREILKWGKGDTSSVILEGKPDWDVVSKSRWLIVSWDTLSRHQDWFAGKWPLWILDESVLAKSRRSQRSMALRGGTRRRREKLDGTVVTEKKWTNIRRNIDKVWLLSGSPTTRHSDDLWAQFNLIWPRAFSSYWRFTERYCVIEESPWAKTVVGDRRDRDVAADNSDLMIVVNQKDVFDLPEYLYEPNVEVQLQGKQLKAYKDMLKYFIATLESGEEIIAETRMGQLMKLQQIVSYWDGESAKHDAVVSMIPRYEAPFLLWTHWREGADKLTERLYDEGLKVAHVRGGMKDADKDQFLEDYKKGMYDALVMSTTVGKFGHTLINTRTVGYVDKTFNADDFIQSLGRVRRIGLTHRPVVLNFYAPGTVDDLVELNLEGKVGSIAKITNASLRELLLGLGRSTVGE